MLCNECDKLPKCDCCGKVIKREDSYSRVFNPYLGGKPEDHWQMDIDKTGTKFYWQQ